MEATPTDPASSTSSEERNTHPLVRFASWFLPCLVLCVVLARAVVIVQAYWAPLIVFSLLVGMLLGAIVAAMLFLAGQQHSRIVMPAVAILALAMLVAEHYYFFRDQRMAEHAAYERAQAESKTARLIHIPPPDLSVASFLRFFQANAAKPWRAGAWALDASLVLATAISTVRICTRSGMLHASQAQIEQVSG